MNRDNALLEVLESRYITRRHDCGIERMVNLIFMSKLKMRSSIPRAANINDAHDLVLGDFHQMNRDCDQILMF